MIVTSASAVVIDASLVPVSLAAMSRNSRAAAAPISAPARRCVPTTVVWARLGFIATIAAIGVQSA